MVTIHFDYFDASLDYRRNTITFNFECPRSPFDGTEHTVVLNGICHKKEAIRYAKYYIQSILLGLVPYESCTTSGNYVHLYP